MINNMSNIVKIDNYKPLIGNCIGVYRYIEGEDHEHFLANFQNCEYYTYNEDKGFDNNTHLINGKHWWILWPYIPINDNNIIKNNDGTSNVVWFVSDTSKLFDIDKEWDFQTHKVK